MKTGYRYFVSAFALCAGLSAASHAFAAVSASEAAALKTTLTPLGAEKAGNADGTIPAWTGGLVDPDYNKNRGRRDDLFKDDKPLFSVTAANMAQYADKLTEGTKAMLTKYPDSYRVDVYKTIRSEAAPQWVYDNTFANATSAKLVDSSDGQVPTGAFGGIPFPIPKNGSEAMWSYILNWRGTSVLWPNWTAHLVTANGQKVVTSKGSIELQYRYYIERNRANFDGGYSTYFLEFSGPPVRAGEMFAGRENLVQKDAQVWVYLTGQRRVRMLPNGCCDTPAPSSAGVMTWDELFVWYGTIQRFDWTLVGKKEMYIPYNENAGLSAKNMDYLGDHHLNPDHQRYELHRVWVVDAKLKPGNRHVAKHSRYYIDEDSWNAVLGERWDSNDNLWKMLYLIPVTAPDMPGVIPISMGFYDMLSSAYFVNTMPNESDSMAKIMPEWPEDEFSGEALSSRGIR